MKRIIFFLFALLTFLVPIVLWPYTSEVFEFNKIVLVYILTTLIVAAWLSRCLADKKIIFRRTILDTPLLIFLASQIISTVLSIDPATSIFGYYSRFNGGLLSTIAYLLLYWAFVSNLEKKDAINLVKFALLPSAALVSIYGVAEHFGIDKNIWVQDVASRVFSTLGQPNWLAAWLTALLPITWVFAIKSKFKSKSFFVYFLLSGLFFWTLIFTKSRSGLLGFVVASLIFWGFYFWNKRKEYRTPLPTFAAIGFSLLAISLISGTEFTPSLYSLINKSTIHPIAQSTGGTALETGGTESGTIRKIVWKGAIQVWLHYPVFGTGVETFAYSYYKFRPAEHNITSEWDFIYNKAHNEYLNFAANTGTAGLLSYLALIFFSIVQISKSKFLISKQTTNPKLGNSKNYLGQLEQLEINNLGIALTAGYVSILITNFFGFSVVPTQLEFFLFPALAVVSSMQNVEWKKQNKVAATQKALIAAVILATGYLLLATYRYWFADTLYAKGRAYNAAGKADTATNYLTRAISIEPNQALYPAELANSYTTLALAFSQQKDAANTKKYADLAISESDRAISLSPANLNLKRSRFGVFIRLSTINPNYLLNARDTLIDAIAFAPTDAKLYYNLGLTYARIGDVKNATLTLKKAIELKANYKEARLAYAILLINEKQNAEAKAQLEYILTSIDPNDSLTKQTLESIK